MAAAERFDLPRKAWVPLPCTIEFEPRGDRARIRFPTMLLVHPLTARLDFKRLPHYTEWVAQRQAQGGAAWTALKVVLDELGDGPLVALTHEPVPAAGPLTVLVGLRRGSQFELYATIPGALSPCGAQTCFEPGEPVFASQSAGLAWALLRPLALKQARNASKF